MGSGKKIIVAGTLQSSGTNIFGGGDATASPVGGSLRGANATGTNLNGAGITISAGTGTGTGTSGNIVFQTAPAGSTGPTPNTLRAALTIDSSANINLNVANAVIKRSDGYNYGAVLTGVNLQIGTSYTFVAADAGGVVEMSNTSANTITLSAVAFPIGTTLTVVSGNTGQTTIAAGVGVTINSYGNKLKLTGRYSMATLVKKDASNWYLAGDLVG